MTESATGAGLTRRQQEFAERMDCRLVTPCPDRSVCFYRVIAHETVRWIVDVDGSVLDWTVFHAGS
jgi:hypothetical protein